MLESLSHPLYHVWNTTYPCIINLASIWYFPTSHLQTEPCKLVWFLHEFEITRL